MIERIKGFFQSLNPANTPAAIAEQGGIRPIQERILQSTLLFISAGTVFLIAFGVPALFRNQDNFAGIFLTFIGVAFIVLTLWRNSPFGLKAQLLIITLYLVAFSTFTQTGINTFGGILLFGYVIFTAVLFGGGAGWRAVILSALTIVFLAFAFTSKMIVPPAAGSVLDPTRPVNWLQFGLPMAILFSLAVSAINTLLSHLAANVERVNFFTTNYELERKKLAAGVEQGELRLARRESQLRTASQISRDFSSMMDPKLLLERVVESIRENFNLYYAGIFLLDEDGRYATLRAGTGEAGEKMLAANHRLEIGGASMIGWCVSNRKARIALDVGAEQVRFNNPYLPLTRSEMALPIVYQDRAIGALTIQSVEPRAFVDEDVMILQGIADSLAIALENATLFQNTQQALEELRVYNQNYIQDTWGRTLASQGDLAFSYQNQAAITTAGDIHTMSMPVTLRDQKIGEINIETSGEAIGMEDRAFLDAILTQTALALENARLLEETQRRAVQEQKLNDLSTQLSKASSIEYILQTAARELGQLPMVSEVSVQLVSSNKEVSSDHPGSNGRDLNGKEH